jgi:hypothetical protein
MLKRKQWTTKEIINDIIWHYDTTMLNGAKIKSKGINQLYGYIFVFRVGESIKSFGYRKKDDSNINPEIDNWTFVNFSDSDIHMIMTKLVKNNKILEERP